MSNTQNYHKPKYADFYMSLAVEASKQSVAKVATVGACIVLPNGLTSLGWNGTPSGQDNDCEDDTGKTKPNVIHAEMNAIKKLLVAGISIRGAKLFTTMAPCSKCANQLTDIGLSEVWYLHDYKDDDGIKILLDSNISVYTKS